MDWSDKLTPPKRDWHNRKEARSRARNGDNTQMPALLVDNDTGAGTSTVRDQSYGAEARNGQSRKSKTHANQRTRTGRSPQEATDLTFNNASGTANNARRGSVIWLFGVGTLARVLMVLSIIIFLFNCIPSSWWINLLSKTQRRQSQHILGFQLGLSTWTQDIRNAAVHIPSTPPTLRGWPQQPNLEEMQLFLQQEIKESCDLVDQLNHWLTHTSIPRLVVEYSEQHCNEFFSVLSSIVDDLTRSSSRLYLLLMAIDETITHTVTANTHVTTSLLWANKVYEDSLQNVYSTPDQNDLDASKNIRSVAYDWTRDIAGYAEVWKTLSTVVSQCHRRLMRCHKTLDQILTAQSRLDSEYNVSDMQSQSGKNKEFVVVEATCVIPPHATVSAMFLGEDSLQGLWTSPHSQRQFATYYQYLRLNQRRSR